MLSACSWGGYLTPKGVVDDGDGVFTSSMGGKSEVCPILVQGADK